MTPQAQAASLQLGLRGQAREFAMSIPTGAIAFGAAVNGVHTDPVTYLMFSLAERFEALEDERIMQSGNTVLDFRGRPNETIDMLLTCFESAASCMHISVGSQLKRCKFSRPEVHFVASKAAS